jgi:hypothetical protein
VSGTPGGRDHATDQPLRATNIDLWRSMPNAMGRGLIRHPQPYFQAKNRQGTESSTLSRRAGTGCGCRNFLRRRNLTEAAGGFLLGLLLGCLGTGDKERI